MSIKLKRIFSCILIFLIIISTLFNDGIYAFATEKEDTRVVVEDNKNNKNNITTTSNKNNKTDTTDINDNFDDSNVGNFGNLPTNMKIINESEDESFNANNIVFTQKDSEGNIINNSKESRAAGAWSLYVGGRLRYRDYGMGNTYSTSHMVVRYNDGDESIAYCLEPTVDTPGSADNQDQPGGVLWDSSTDYDNVTKALYFLYGGPGNIASRYYGSWEEQYILTHAVVSYYYNSEQDWSYGLNQTTINNCYNAINTIDNSTVPTGKGTLSPTTKKAVLSDNDTKQAVSFEVSCPGTRMYISVPLDCTVDGVDRNGYANDGATITIKAPLEKLGKTTVSGTLERGAPSMTRYQYDNGTEQVCGGVIVNGEWKKENASATIEWIDREIFVKKVDENGIPFKGATLEVYKDGNLLDRFVTDGTEHKVLFPGIGRCTIKEVASPRGYIIADEISFNVTASTIKYYSTMKNNPTKVAFSKYTDIDFQDKNQSDVKLDGAVLNLKGIDNDVNITWTSSKGNDPYVIEKLPIKASYILTEVTTPYGFVKADPIEFKINEKGKITVTKRGNIAVNEDILLENAITNPIRMEDKHVYGQLNLHKKADQLTSIVKNKTYNYDTYQFNWSPNLGQGNVQFGLYAAETISLQGVSIYQKDQMIKVLTTDKDGNCSYGKLPLGRYYMKEIESSVQPNYFFNSSIIYFELSYKNDAYENINVSDSQQIKNERMKTSVNVSKVSKQNQTPVENCYFGLYTKNIIDSNRFVKWESNKFNINADGLISVAKTDKSGKATFNVDIPIGEYYVKELAVPEGFTLSSQIIPVTFKGEEVFDCTFENAETEVHVAKVNELNEPQEGCHLQIIDKVSKKVVREWTTTKYDHIEYKLPYGTYILRETSAPEGYLLADDIEFTLDKSEINENNYVKRIEIKNKPTYVSFYKYSDFKFTSSGVNNATNVPILGATLQVVDENDKVYDTWTTTGNANYTISKLPINKNYILKEIVTPEGFLKAKDINFKIDSVGNVIVNGKTILYKDAKDTPIKMEDVPVTGKLAITKTGEVLNSVSPITKIKNYISYVFNWVTGTLKDVEFKVFASENIYLQNKLLYSKDDYIATIKTGADGIATYEGLPLGSYYMQEVKTNSDHVLPDSTKYFTFVELYKDDKTPVVEVINTIDNVRKQFNVDVIKKDKSGQPVENCIFGLYTKQDIVVGSTTIKKDTMVDVASSILTNGKSIAQFTVDLPKGTYYVKELEAPSGYILSDEIKEFTYNYTDTNEENTTFTIDFVNDYSEIDILKLDGTTKAPLAGAHLQILDKNSKQVLREWISDLTEHRETTLPYGTYILHEQSAPDGYVPFNDKLITISKENPHIKVSVENTKIRSAIVKKDDDGNRVAGAYLQLFNEANELVDAWVSDSRQYHPLPEGLVSGNYRIHEETTPSGYATNPDQWIYLDETKDMQYFEFINKKINLTIDKVDNNGEPVTNAQLSLYRKSTGAKVDEWITDGNPYVIKSLSSGTYIVRETMTPDGYVTAQEQEIVITKNQADYQVTMIDEKLDVSIQKVSGRTSKPVIGATMGLSTVDGFILETWKTTETAHKLEEIPSGTYYLQELEVPTGYAIMNPNPLKIVIKDTAEPQLYTAIDEELTVHVDKLDGLQNPVIGATLQLLDKDDKVVYEWISDGTTHKLYTIPAGTYTLHEAKTPNGYVTAEDVTFTIKNDGTTNLTELTMIDEETKISISKVDENNAFVEGATLQVLDESGKNVILEWITTQETKDISKLPIGNYILRELITPDGYVTAKDIPFTVTDEHKVVSLTMVNKKTILNVTKTNEDNNYLAGAILQILKTDGTIVKEFESENASTAFKGLPIGDYILHEVSAPYGYLLADDVAFSVLNQEEPSSVIMQDKKLKVMINKTTIDGTHLAGATLQVLNTDNTILDEWVTDGTPHRVKNIDTYGTYILREIDAPNGFELAKDMVLDVTNDNSEFSFTMIDEKEKAVHMDVAIAKVDETDNYVAGANLQVLNKDTNEIVFEYVSTNELQTVRLDKGTYILHEVAAPDGYELAEDIIFTVGLDEHSVALVKMIDKKITKVEISKVDITNEKELPGAKLTIKDSDDKVIKTWISTDKPHYIEKLPVGKYTLIEEIAPNGYVTANSITFEVTDTTDIQKVMMKDDVTKVEISKQDITNKKELPGAKLTIKDSTDKVIETWISTDKPHYIEKLPVGKYTLIEEIAPNGYVTAIPIEFEVKDSDDIQKVIMKDDVTKVEISKQDITDKKELPGAKLTIKDGNDKVVESWTSTDKPHYIEKLSIGKYTLIEEVAPNGYKVAESITFEVKDNGEVVKVVMYDEKVVEETTPSSNGNTETTQFNGDGNSETKTNEQVKTNDINTSIIYLLGLISMISIIGIFIYKKKKK